MNQKTDNLSGEYEQQLREMNAELLVSAVRQQELADEARRADARRRLALDSAELGSWHLDIASMQYEIDERFRTIWGIPADQSYEQTLTCIHPEDQVRVDEAVAATIRVDDPAPYDIQYRVVHPDDSIHWVHSKGRLNLHGTEPHEDPATLDGTIADITERKLGEEALLRSEEKYRTLFETIDEGVTTLEVVFDKNGRAVDWVYLENNPAFAKLSGLPADVIGRRVSDILPNLEPFWFETYGRVATTGEPERVEHAVAEVGRWFDVHVSRVGAAGSHQVVVVYSNITMRKRHEANLAFLAEVTADLVRQTNIDETMGILGEKIGEYFDLSVCAFTEINEAADVAVVLYDWHREEVPSVVGSYYLPDFISEDFQRAGRAGEVTVVRDVVTDPRTDAEGYAKLKIRSFACVPLVRDGEWRYMLGIYHSEPRDWREDEIELLRELTARIWTRLERARAENALHASEVRFRSLFESAPMAVFACDSNAVIQDYNNHAVRLWGREPECGVERHCGSVKLWLPDGSHLPHTESPLVEVLRTGNAASNVEVYIERPDGSRVPVLVNFAALKDAEGQITGGITSFVDLTDRKKAEDKLAEQKRLLEALTESVLDGILIVAPGGHMLHHNQRFLDMWNFPAELIGLKSDQAALAWAAEQTTDPAAFLGRVDHIYSQPDVQFREEMWMKDGRVYERFGAPVQHGETRLGWVWTFRDITEGKKAEMALRASEEALRRSRDELEDRVEERTAELNETGKLLQRESAEREKAQEQRLLLLKKILTVQEDERRRIARDMHDHFGQQLTGLRLNLDAMGHAAGIDDALKEKIHMVQGLAEDLDSDVNFLVWELRPTALDDLGITAAIEHYVRRWSEQCEIPAAFHGYGFDDKELAGDVATNLYRITQEALNNTAKHARATQASVVMEKRGNKVLLIVEDDGLGFNAATQKRSGLGLKGMRERADLVGGTIEIESAPGSGTTIYVTIPITPIAPIAEMVGKVQQKG